MARKPNPLYMYIVNEANGDNAEFLIDEIDPNPFQCRRYFDEAALKELGQSIEEHGMIQPITVRFKPDDGRYELICGERRFRAVRDYCTRKVIRAQIVTADDEQAKLTVVLENLQREDLSPIETTEAVVMLVDSALLNSPQAEDYALLGKTENERLNVLLEKLAHVVQAKRRGETIGVEGSELHNKFIILVNSIFENLPKPLKWHSFFINQLPNIQQTTSEVLQIAVRWRLSHSLVKALRKLSDANPNEIERLMISTEELESLEKQGVTPQKRGYDLRTMTAKKVNSITKRILAKKSKNEENRGGSLLLYSREVCIRILSRLVRLPLQIWENSNGLGTIGLAHR